MVIERGQLWWADLGEPCGSGPGYQRPVVIVQADGFNQSQLSTAIVAIITSNIRLAKMPGNVVLTARSSGLERESVVNVTQLFTIDKADLSEYVGRLNRSKMKQIDEGLRLVLSL